MGLAGAIAKRAFGISPALEKLRFNPPRSRQQLEALAVVVGVESDSASAPLRDRLAQMLPPPSWGGNEV